MNLKTALDPRKTRKSRKSRKPKLDAALNDTKYFMKTLLIC